MNKDLFFDGEKFISARRAAQEVGYAEDYVGQLCRDGKLPSRMVGRSWYVSRKAILAHKKKGTVLDKAPALASKDLFFNGERFLSSARAAKAVGYANDYIGQLCRSGALDCRMVGRSWYVSRKAILAHKKNGYKNSSEPKKIKSQVQLPRTKNVAVTKVVEIPAPTEVFYQTTKASARPQLTKPTETPKRWRFVTGLVVVGVTVFVIFNVATAWLAFISPKASDTVNVGVADASNVLGQKLTATAINTEGFVGFLFGGIGNDIAKLFAPSAPQNTSSEANASNSNNGLVAVPDNARHADDVTKIQQDFSDPVNVTFDQDGQSGVITPDFRDASSGNTYTFVMVPVAKTK